MDKFLITNLNDPESKFEVDLDALKMILIIASNETSEDIERFGSKPIGELVTWNGTFSNKQGEFDVIKLRNQMADLETSYKRKDLLDDMRKSLKLLVGSA